MHNTHAKIRCNKIQMHRQTNACSINNGTMDATNRMMPPKRIICNGKHFSISLAANRKSIEMNASEKIIVCCSVDSIPTIYTNGVNKYTPCIRKKSIPNIYQHNEKQKEYFQTKLHTSYTTNHKLRKGNMFSMKWEWNSRDSAKQPSAFFLSFFSNGLNNSNVTE